jgi:RNA polymerase sigma-70 factor, ECF subfamily
MDTKWHCSWANLCHIIVLKGAIMTTEPTTACRANEEAIFIQGLRTGSQQVFARMYERFSPPLYSFVLSRVKDTEVAENLLQDVFVKVWRNSGQYDEAKGRLFIWIYKICNNCCIDYLRSKQHRISRQSLLNGNLLDVLPHQSQKGVSPDRIGLYKMVRQLKNEEREIVELLYFRGYTQAEVAGLKNMPLGTVKTRCTRAIQQLRRLFEYQQPNWEPSVALAG